MVRLLLWGMLPHRGVGIMGKVRRGNLEGPEEREDQKACAPENISPMFQTPEVSQALMSSLKDAAAALQPDSN